VSREAVSTQLALGVNAGLDSSWAHQLARRCESLGYHSIWSNDEPGAGGLEMVARFAASTSRISLGVGVLPLDRYTPVEIAAGIERLRLQPERMLIGIGSGRLEPQLEVVRDAVRELRSVLPPEIRIVVAAMRPRMCRLAGAVADGVLLNWMLPAQAAQARQWVGEGADGVERPRPVVASYIRVAVGSGAAERLQHDESRYRDIDDRHRQHFAAMDAPLGSVGIAASGPAEVAAGLERYRPALDLPIVRALADDPALLLDVAEAAAPRARPVLEP
jgi:alkanesulfonate monooxygenase SsuD/methylene tetrahydromethanopterin reductase-like flavin-dependent oxidoreductase (luciferase family)